MYNFEGLEPEHNLEGLKPSKQYNFEGLAPEPAEDLRRYGIPEGAGEPISTITGKPLITDFGKPKEGEQYNLGGLEPETDFIDRVKASWKTGVAQTELGQLRYQQLLGEDTDEIKQQITNLKTGMPEPDKVKRSLPERAVRAATEMLPIQVAGLKKGIKRGVALGTGFAGIAALAGQAGPQAATPEEVVTVPAAFAGGYGVGTLSGTIESIGQIEAGLAYDELLNLKDDKGNRVDPVIAKAAAASVGVINGLIEMAQIKLLLKTIPGGEALLRGTINKTLKKAVTDKTLKSIALKYVGKYGVFVAGETGQEILQESTNILANEIAKDVTNELKGTDLPAATIQEIGNRLVDTAKQSALAFSVMGMPGTAVSGISEAARLKPSAEPAPSSPFANIIDEGMATGELEGQPFTPEHAINLIQEAYADKALTDEDINQFKEKYPALQPALSEIVADGVQEVKPEVKTEVELKEGKALTDEEITAIKPTPIEPTAEVAREPVGVETIAKETGATYKGEAEGLHYWDVDVGRETPTTIATEKIDIKELQKKIADTKETFAVEKIEKAKVKEPWEITLEESVDQRKEKAIKSGVEIDEITEDQIKMWEQAHIEEIVNSPRDTDISAKILASLPETTRESMLRTHPIAASNWVDTFKIWNKPYREILADVRVRAGIGKVKKMHRDAVEKAIKANKPVPKEVLAEYPDLKPLSPKPPKAKPSEARIFKDKELAGKTVTIKVLDKKTNKLVEKEQDAKTTLNEAEKKSEDMRKLLECLT